LGSEARLSEALDQLPNAPVPSNFTANVLQAVQLEENAQETREPTQISLVAPASMAPQAALAALALAAGFLAYRHGQTVRRAELRTA